MGKGLPVAGGFSFWLLGRKPILESRALLTLRVRKAKRAAYLAFGQTHFGFPGRAALASWVRLCDLQTCSGRKGPGNVVGGKLPLTDEGPVTRNSSWRYPGGWREALIPELD